MSDQDLKIQELEKEQNGIMIKVQEVKIIDQVTLTDAVSFTQEIKRAIKRVEDLRKFFVNPLNKQVKEINLKFKPIITDFESAEKKLKEKIIAYQNEEEVKRLKEEDRLRKLQEKKYEKEIAKSEKKGEIAPPPPAPVHIEKPKTEGLRITKRWTYEIVNEAEVPREYLCVDTKKIGKVVSAGIRDIKGVRIYQETGSAIGSKDEIDSL